MPGKLLRHCLSRHAPLRIGGRLGPGGSRWLWQWWRSCRLETYERNRGRMHRLAHAGRNRRLMLTRLLHLDVERGQGYLVLLRRAEDLELARPGLKLLADLGVRHELLDAEGCRRVEPGLNPATPLHAGIHVVDDEVANCRQFAQVLRREAETLGARFCFHADVTAIAGGPRPVLHWAPRPPQAGAAARPPVPQADEFDAVVVCAALDSRRLLAPLGLKLPLLAVHGYSITAPMREVHGEADAGAELGRHGRTLQGLDQPDRQPPARGGQRRDRRLAGPQQPGRAGNTAPCARRLVPRLGSHRRRPSSGKVRDRCCPTGRR